jgi:hypothetical protein
MSQWKQNRCSLREENSVYKKETQQQRLVMHDARQVP